jgi:hypothetical protein
MNLGRLAELREEQMTLRVEIDAAVKAMIYQFDPIDADLAYVDKIMPDRLHVYVKTIERKKKMLDKLNLEIRRLEGEVGERPEGA